MAINYYNHNDNENNDDLIEDEEEEDYIDMEVSSLTHFIPKNKTFPSPQHAQEFAFHLSSSNVDRDLSPSPADELFYKGKLLPLHLPPRLQMVEKLLLDSPSSSHFNKFREAYGTPLGTTTTPTPTTSTPFESCNISPVDSGQVSRELCPEEYFREYNEPNGDERKGLVFLSEHQKLSWTKKIKSKIKSLFGKPGCSDQPTDASTTANVKELQLIGKGIRFDKETKVPQKEVKEEIVCHRRSFSGAFKRRSSTTKLSSSSSSGSSASSSSSTSTSSSNSSNNSSSLSELLLKRSSSANSEIETSLIQGAIAHCKQSQQTVRSRKTLSEIGCHSFPSKFVAFDDQDCTTGLCRG